MTLTEHIISQALSREPGAAARAFITGRQRRLEKKAEKRADLLARPDVLQKRVADHAQVLSLSTRKLRTRKYGTKLEALEAQARGTPQEGFASELLTEYTAALEDPKYLDVTDRQLLAGVTQNLMFRPDKEGRSRLEKGYRYKWRADTSLGNIFGIFGEDKGVRKLPGYKEYIEKQRAKPVDKWDTGPAEAAAFGAGATTALMAGSRLLGRTAMLAPVPGARIAGAALLAIPEFMALDAVHNVLAKTDWHRARTEQWWKGVGVDLLAGGVIIGAGYKTAAVAIRKAAEKSVLSKSVTELLIKHPTAARAIEAGEAQRVAKIAQAKADESIIKNISREDVLGKVGNLTAVLTKVGEKKAREEGLTGLAQTLKRIERTKAKEEIADMVKGLGFTKEKKAEVGAMVRGLRTAAARPAEIEAAFVERAERLTTEIETLEETAKGLLNKVQEAAGVKKVSRKKAAKIFTKELSNEGVEAATKKAGKTGRMREAVVEQQRVQQLAREQAKREKKPLVLPEESKITVSAERAKTRKKKKLEGDIAKAKVVTAPVSKVVPKAVTEAERLKAIKERAEIIRKEKGFPSEEVAIKSEVEGEFKHISLEEAGLIETFEGGVEESMGGFKRETTKDLIDLFGDAKKLFSVGAVGVAALLSPREVEAAPVPTLIKMGLKAGKEIVRKIPKLKNTEEALLFGRTATPEQAAELTKLRGATEKAASKLMKEEQFDEAMIIATESQLYREALEAYEGLPHVVEALKGMGVGAVALFGSTLLADLFTPDSAEASMLKPLGVTVPKIAASVIKGTRGKMIKLAGDMKDAGFLHVPITKGSKEVLYFQNTISTAKLAVEKHGNLIKSIKADVSPFGRWLTKKLSPYTTGDILYHVNPISEVGNLQSVIGNNVMNSMTAVGNVLRDVPGLLKRGTSEVIEKAMAPLAKRYSTDVAAYRAVTTELEKLEKPYAKLYKALSREGGEQHILALEKMEAKRASLLVAKDELEPIFVRYTKDWEKEVVKLASKHPTTRVALACEDTAAYTKYPWLKPLMKPEEEEAVIWLKDLNQSYGIRMAEAGHDVIEGPYCHHALHPEWIETRAVERLREFGLDSKALPFSKFFHRAKYSRMMMPDINYTMQKYLLDAERRIQWSKFWGKGEKNSWYAHKRWVDTFGTEDQRDFWRRLSNSAIPPAQTKGNILANIYSSFEVARLLDFSPSVALKHYFKNIGTMSVMGVGNFLSHLPEAVITSVKGARNSPEMKTIYKLLGVKGTKGKRKVFDEVADSFITQIHRMNMVADLDFEAMIPNKAGFWKAATEKLQGFNRWGSIPVRMIEAVDRHHTVLAAWEAAAKKGMTAQQAIYGIYGNILKLNFLSGAANPAWVRNPKIRSILLFQNTAFKIMERRLMTAWKAGKDVKTTIGVVRHQDIQKTLKEMTEIGRYVLGAERELKQNMIFDALTGSKDFFGSSAIRQAITEATISGAILGGGGIVGMNLMPQVFHLPLLAHGAKAPTIAVNPFLNAMFRVAGEREKAEEYGVEKDFMLTAFAKSWLKGSGYVNQTANKMIRISKHDIPEIYKGSKWSYFFSIPGKEEY